MDAERNISERIQDSLRRFAQDVECFVATTNPDGHPNVVPLSVVWQEGAFVLCTRRSTRTVRNIRDRAVARLVFGPTRDVVLVDVAVEVGEIADVRTETLAAFNDHVGWNIAEETDRYVVLTCRPRTIQAWRQERERTLMENGRWLLTTPPRGSPGSGAPPWST